MTLMRYLRKQGVNFYPFTSTHATNNPGPGTYRACHFVVGSRRALGHHDQWKVVGRTYGTGPAALVLNNSNSNQHCIIESPIATNAAPEHRNQVETCDVELGGSGSWIQLKGSLTYLGDP
jgi:hypothetical protein